MKCKIYKCKNNIDFSKRGWGAKFCSAECTEAYNQHIKKIKTSDEGDKPATKKDLKILERNLRDCLNIIYLQQKKILEQNKN